MIKFGVILLMLLFYSCAYVQYEGIHEQLTWVEDMLRYNTVGGKMNRGMGVVDVLSAFAKVKGNELSHLDVSPAQDLVSYIGAAPPSLP